MVLLLQADYTTQCDHMTIYRYDTTVCIDIMFYSFANNNGQILFNINEK